MLFLQGGYGFKNGLNYWNKEVLDARFGNRIRIIFVRNSCYIKINDGERTEYKANTLFIASSGMKMEWGSLDDGQCYIDDWIEFSAEDNELAEFGLKSGMIVPEIPIEYAKSLSKSIKFLVLEHFNNEVYYSMAINARLQLFLIDLARYVNSNEVYEMKQNHSHPYYQKLVKMREKLLNSVFEDYSLENLCKENDMSVSHFRRLYREVFNNPLNKDILARKVDVAQKMIANNPNGSISQIIDALGYSYHETFYRQFKQRVGVTPLEYKKKCMANSDERK